MLAAFQAKDQAALKALAERDDPDPWLVADELCFRGEHSAAEAFAPLGERHLRRVLRHYVEYYNRCRCHLALEGIAPEPREVEGGPGPVRAIAHFGGLHHRYKRAG